MGTCTHSPACDRHSTRKVSDHEGCAEQDEEEEEEEEEEEDEEEEDEEEDEVADGDALVWSINRV